MHMRGSISRLHNTLRHHEQCYDEHTTGNQHEPLNTWRARALVMGPLRRPARHHYRMYCTPPIVVSCAAQNKPCKKPVLWRSAEYG